MSIYVMTMAVHFVLYKTPYNTVYTVHDNEKHIFSAP